MIAGDRLGLPISVQGGGSDLVFPHHEMSAGHAAALAHQPLAHAYVHTGMVAYQGEKISKSLGNLVTVRGLLDDGADPRAIRLALLSHQYSRRLGVVRRASSPSADTPPGDVGRVGRPAATPDTPTTRTTSSRRVRARVADDLDTPGRRRGASTRAIAGGTAVTPELVDLVDALLGIRIG